MFTVSGRTIRLSRGDTGIIAFSVEGVALTDADRAVFSIRRPSGGILIQKVIAPENGRFYMPFINAETDRWKPGVYQWDIRIVLDARMQTDERVTDGREVITPWPPSLFEVIKVVGEV